MTTVYPETDAHVAQQRAIAEATRNPVMFAAHSRLGIDDDLTLLTQVAGSVAASWNVHSSEPWVMQVLTAFVRLIPMLRLVSADHEQNTAAWHWAPIRCILSYAGHANWGQLITPLLDTYSACPFSPEETHEDWHAALVEAHTMCGWPCTTIALPWTQVRRAFQDVERKGYYPPDWMRAFACLHFLKHTRMTGNILRVVYNGRASFLETVPKTNILGSIPGVTKFLAETLGASSVLDQRRAQANPVDLALVQTISALRLAEVPAAAPMAALPPELFAGPWSTLRATGTPPTDTMPTGMTIHGVWKLNGTTLSPYTGEPHEVMGYAWPLVPSPESIEAGERFAHMAATATYTNTGLPIDPLICAFPNIVADWLRAIEKVAIEDAAVMYRCVMSAPICASLMRHKVHQLSHEFPLFMVLPNAPTLDGSTNQGKSVFTHAYARAMAPGVPLVMAPTGSSAPDNRAMADICASYGTWCLDEWYPSESKGNILNHQNLQALITGGTVACGKVLENSGHISLRHSMAVSCKTTEFPPDMLNRTLCMWLDPLTDAQRLDGTVAQQLQSGVTSVSARLTAMRCIRDYDLLSFVEQAIPSTVGWRFPMHTTIAIGLFKGITGRMPPPHLLREIVSTMHMRMMQHMKEADVTGLALQVRESAVVSLTLPTIFYDLIDLDVEQIRTEAEARGRTHSGLRWCTISGIMRARANIMGIGNAPLTRLYAALTGSRHTVSDRSLVFAATTWIKENIPPESPWRIPGTNWNLFRGSVAHEEAYGRCTFLRFERVPAEENDPLAITQ